MSSFQNTKVFSQEEEQRLALRRERKLQPLDGIQDGVSLADLPGGIYGFTYSPSGEFPVFAKHGYHSFELHKVAAEEAYLIGFVTPGQAGKLEAGALQDFDLYPSPHAEANQIVSLNTGRISKSKAPRTDGNPVQVTVY